ncbi:MAG: DUF2079 domain-containing protein [Chloroflexi bacterium]|nr:MAG: DUF2079 domain-containing protein [Chloroflexota bacterium]
MDLLVWQEGRLLLLSSIAGGWLILLFSIVVVPVWAQRHERFHAIYRFAQHRFTPYIFLGILLAIFMAAYGWLVLSRHGRFNSTGYDLAIHEQILWNTLNGRFFATSLEVDNSFADHFRPFMLVLLPFYAVFQSAKTLLVAQVLALAAAAIPLFLIADARLKSKRVAMAITFMYLIYPAVGFVARFDFHMEAIAVPLFFMAFYALEKEKWKQATIWLILTLLCKENMGIVVAIFGLYVMVMQRRWRLGTAWLIMGITTFLFTSFWLLPTVRGESLDAMIRYTWMGDTTTEIAQTIFTKPELIWEHLISTNRLLYLVQLSEPVGFLNFLGLPEIMIAQPFLMTNLMADHFCQPTIYCHYSAPVIPFIFIGLVFGLARLRRWLRDERSWRIAILLVLPLSMFNFWIENPFREIPLIPSALLPISNADVVEQALTAVPPHLSVVTTNDYAPHLAQREHLYIIGIPTQREAPIDPEVVFLNLYDQQYIICDGYREYVSQLDIDTYGVTFRTGGLIVMQRNAGSNEQFRDFVQNWNNCAG